MWTRWGPGNSPRLLYRVYVKDGLKGEPGAWGRCLTQLDAAAPYEMSLVALGDDPLVSNRMGGVPQNHPFPPSLLFDELEVKRADTSKDKLPEYPAPGSKN